MATAAAAEAAGLPPPPGGTATRPSRAAPRTAGYRSQQEAPGSLLCGPNGETHPRNVGESPASVLFVGAAPRVSLQPVTHPDRVVGGGVPPAPLYSGDDE